MKIIEPSQNDKLQLQSPLFKFPAEVRELIWEAYYDQRTVDLEADKNGKLKVVCRGLAGTVFPEHVLRLLLSCKRIYHEAVPAYFAAQKYVGIYENLLPCLKDPTQLHPLVLHNIHSFRLIKPSRPYFKKTAKGERCEVDEFIDYFASLKSLKDFEVDLMVSTEDDHAENVEAYWASYARLAHVEDLSLSLEYMDDEGMASRRIVKTYKFGKELKVKDDLDEVRNWLRKMGLAP